MKIKVELNYCEPGETIYFTVDRILQLEQMTKKSISQIVDDNFSMNDLVCCLVVGTKHHKLRQPPYFVGKIQKALSDGQAFNEICEPVMKALIGSGILGKKAVYAMFPELAIDELEKDVDEAIDIKNENPTQE